jgi:hypothetical protein
MVVKAKAKARQAMLAVRSMDARDVKVVGELSVLHRY